MAYISLYRKYRPENFDQIIGQDHIVRTLVNQITSGNIGHAYLFTGTRGTGKTTAAKIFARAVNCTDAVNGSPCGKCSVCKELSNPGSLDIMEIDAASNNGVEEIREIRDKVKYPPVSGKYKVYIVDEVHMLSINAFNALLKTLEEPPSHVIFILATTEAHKLPQTILSRCMRFDFRLVSSDLIKRLIMKIYKDMGKEFEDEAVSAIAKAGEGSVRDALSVADMCMSFKEGKLTYYDVMEVTGASSPEMLIAMTDAMLSARLNELLENIENAARQGRNFPILLRDINLTLRNLIYIKNSDNAKEILQLPKDVYDKLYAISVKHDSVRILTALESLVKLEGAMRYSVQPRTVFEAAMVRAAVSGDNLNKDALARLIILEDDIKAIKSGRADIIVSNSVANNSITEQDAVEDIKEVDAGEVKTKSEGAISLKPTEEKAVFGSVEFVRKGEDKAKEIIGSVIRELRQRELFHIQGIFGYNDVKVWISDNKFYMETTDEYGYKQLTDPENNKIISDLLIKYGAGSYDKLIIIEPKKNINIDKSIDDIKQLFDSEILEIRK
jgi:DNA polymerase-3 subunit gamma/tau